MHEYRKRIIGTSQITPVTTAIELHKNLALAGKGSPVEKIRLRARHVVD